MTELDRFARVLDWNLLKYFFQIAQRGGIGAAAESLNLSQPSISAALRRLEEHIGLQLCVRTRKGVRLTAAGERLLQACDDIVARLSTAPANLRAASGALGGSVLLKTISHVTCPALDAGLVAFKRQHPDVELVLETAPWKHIVTSLLKGDSAVAVGFDDRPQPELEHALLMRERLQLYCGRSHPLYGRTVADPAELAGEPFVAFNDGEPPALKAFRAEHGLGERLGGIADNVYEAAWLIGLGVGIGCLPEPMATTMGQRLSPLLQQGFAPQVDIFLLWRPDLQDRAARLLVSQVLAELGTRDRP